jgi:biopolymer transport protein ExbD
MPRLEAPADASIRRSGRRGHSPRVHTSLAEINVVPLVDVMLVLLVIFMVTAPMMQQGFAVSLPQSRQAKALSAEPIYVTVPATFHQDQHVQINDKRIQLSSLENQTRQALDSHGTKDVFLRADGSVSYADVILVFDQLKKAGVRNVNLATQPPESGR